MAIAVLCPSCGKSFRVKDEHRGLQGQCPMCQKPVTADGPRVPDHDVFISYSNKDKAVADAVCAAVENARMRCWIAPRDIPAGDKWGSAIIDAIGDSQVMVLIYSSHANTSDQVLSEVERAVAKAKPILPFRIEDAPLSKNMELFLSSRHWMDAVTEPLEEHIGRLVTRLRALIKAGQQSPPENADAPMALSGVPVPPARDRHEPPGDIREEQCAAPSAATPAAIPASNQGGSPAAAPPPQQAVPGTLVLSKRVVAALIAANGVLAAALVIGMVFFFTHSRAPGDEKLSASSTPTGNAETSYTKPLAAAPEASETIPIIQPEPTPRAQNATEPEEGSSTERPATPPGTLPVRITLDAQNAYFYALRFSPDSKRVAGLANITIIVCDLASGKTAKTFQLHDSSPERNMIFTPDGTALLVVDRGVLQILDVEGEGRHQGSFSLGLDVRLMPRGKSFSNYSGFSIRVFAAAPIFLDTELS